MRWLFLVLFLFSASLFAVDFDMKDIQYLKQTLVPANLGRLYAGFKWYGEGFDLGWWGLTLGADLGEYERVKSGYQYVDRPVGFHVRVSFVWLGAMNFWQSVIDSNEWRWGDTWWEGSLLFSWY